MLLNYQQKLFDMLVQANERQAGMRCSAHVQGSSTTECQAAATVVAACNGAFNYNRSSRGSYYISRQQQQPC
jgi:hypothetical protein